MKKKRRKNEEKESEIIETLTSPVFCVINLNRFRLYTNVFVIC